MPRADTSRTEGTTRSALQAVTEYALTHLMTCHYTTIFLIASHYLRLYYIYHTQQPAYPLSTTERKSSRQHKMCQLCQLPIIAKRHAWPPSLRPLGKTLLEQVETAHNAITVHRAQPSNANAETLQKAIEATRPVLISLTKLGQDLTKWWKDPKRAAARAEWEKLLQLEVEVEKTRKARSDMQVYVGRCRGMVSEM